MKKYQDLLFDVDGTLFDFKKAEEEALRMTTEAYGISLDQEFLECYLSINQDLWKRFERGEVSLHTLLYTRFVRTFERMGIDIDGVIFEDDYQDNLGRGFFWLEEGESVCRRLSQNHDLYIITNGVARTQRSRLGGTSLGTMVKGVFISEEMGVRKPQKEFFEIVMSHIPQFDPSSALVIGDSLISDIQGGENAGLDTCWYNPHCQRNDSGFTPTYEITSLRELYEIVGDVYK